MTTFSIDDIASLLTNAYREGYEHGHMLIPAPTPEELFLEYQDSVLDMFADRVMH